MKLDSRSLGVFRVALGLLVISKVVLCFSDTNLLQGGLTNTPIGSCALIWPLWKGIILLSSLCLIVGYFTRISTFLCWVGTLLSQNAYPEFLQGGDALLRLLLFWSLFLPVNRKWSIDSFTPSEAVSDSRSTVRMAEWAITFQVCFVYWFAGLLKTDPLWKQTGDALFYALSIEHFTTPLGLWFHQFPGLLRTVTFAVPWFELLGPLLLFVPVYRDLCRMTAVILFVTFHLIGMQLLLRIGLFPWVCATAWLAFIPKFFWDRIEVFFKTPSEASEKREIFIPKKRRQVSSKTSRILDCAGAGLVSVSFLDVTAWNVASLYGEPALRWMQKHDFYGCTLRLDQRWNMYAPAPRKVHGWLVIPAELTDGSQVDLFTGREVSWKKPTDIGAYFGDDLWRRYLSNLFDDQDPEELQKYADYLVNRWNQSHGSEQKVAAVTIIFMRQETQPDLTVTEPEKQALYFRAY